MTENSVSRPLSHFFGAYFHEDWDLEADDWQGIVDNYVADNAAPESLRRFAQQIDELRGSRTKFDLKDFLVSRVGVAFCPSPLNYGEWLREIADRLRRHAETSDAAIR